MPINKQNVPKKLDDDENDDVPANSRQVSVATQLITAIQNLNNRVANLEINIQKSIANEDILDKQVKFLGDRIDFLEKKLAN